MVTMVVEAVESGRITDVVVGDSSVVIVIDGSGGGSNDGQGGEDGGLGGSGGSYKADDGGWFSDCLSLRSTNSSPFL